MSLFPPPQRNSDFLNFLFFPIKPVQGKNEKRPQYHFFPLTSTDVGISPQIFLTFSFNPFPRLVLNFKALPSASPKLLNLNQEYLKKIKFFCSNPYKIEIMITSLKKYYSYQTLAT